MAPGPSAAADNTPVPVGLPCCRDPAQPGFQELRTRLLAELGAGEPRTAGPDPM